MDIQKHSPEWFQLIQSSTLLSDSHAFGSEEPQHEHPHRQGLKKVKIQTWDERSVPRLTCVLLSGDERMGIINPMGYLVKRNHSIASESIPYSSINRSTEVSFPESLVIS